MPASTTWKYVENQFEVGTRNSYKKMNAVVLDGDAKLVPGLADPDILALYNRLHPVMLAYTGGYNQWHTAQGLYKGATKGLAQQLKVLSSTKARQWDTAVMAVYDLGTPEHTAIFPHGREKLQNGTIDEIIGEVGALIGRLKPYLATPATPATPAITTLSGQITTFWNLLTGLRSVQQGQEGQIPQLSTALEKLRKDAATTLYGNLGSLMRKYETTPTAITGFYDLQLLRKSRKDKPSDIPAIKPILPPPAAA